MNNFFRIVLYALFFLLFFGAVFYFTYAIVTKLIQKKENDGEKKEPSPSPEVMKSLRQKLSQILQRFYKSFRTHKASDTPKSTTSDTIIYCPYCDSKVPKGARKCWHCKNKLPVSFKNLMISAVVSFFAVFFLILCISSFSSDSAAPASTMSKSEYISQCRTISYDTLARNPDSYKGEYFTFTGEVIQVLQQGNKVNLRVNVTPETLFDTTYYSDTIYVVATLPDDGSRILEQDIITLYGVCDGLYTYTTVLGSSMSIPKINVAYWNIKK